MSRPKADKACRHNQGRQNCLYKHLKGPIRGDGGFSLLEILVTLTIISLLLTLVAPPLVSMIGSARFQKTAETSVKALKQLKARAIINNRGYVVLTDNSDDPYPASLIRTRLDVPDDWTVLGPAIYISASGICTGGEILLSHENGRQARYAIEDISCTSTRITHLPDDQG